jgi:hypothetical protein
MGRDPSVGGGIGRLDPRSALPARIGLFGEARGSGSFIVGDELYPTPPPAGLCKSRSRVLGTRRYALSSVTRRPDCPRTGES